MVVAASGVGKVPGTHGGGKAGKGRRAMKGKKKMKIVGDLEKALHKAVQDS